MTVSNTFSAPHVHLLLPALPWTNDGALWTWKGLCDNTEKNSCPEPRGMLCFLSFTTQAADYTPASPQEMLCPYQNCYTSDTDLLPLPKMLLWAPPLESIWDAWFTHMGSHMLLYRIREHFFTVKEVTQWGVESKIPLIQVYAVPGGSSAPNRMLEGSI